MFGRLLKVDLSSGGMTNGQIPFEWTRDYLGASGLAARMLWKALDPTLEPLDPASPLLFITGPMTGTGGPTTGRFAVCGRSPQTGLWGEANIGGFVGPELRAAGFDAVWITGRAPAPVYLWIHDGQAELRPAESLWGRADTNQTQVFIRADVGEPRAKVACIGLAGENLVSCAVILSDHGRAAARTGMGTVMGAKNLKALAVRGTGKIETARPELYKKMRVEANKTLHEQNMTAILHQTGTSGSADYLQIIGDMPQKYWSAATFEGASSISGAEMAETILTGTTGCHACVVACGREVTIPDGPHATQGAVKGPEYETVCAFGPQILVNDLPTITALGNLCDRLGLDTISAGNTIALAYLLYNRRLLTAKDTGGRDLCWGDPKPCFGLLREMARREGFGALLAQGSRALARHCGDEELAVQVAGLDVPMHDPRAFSGQALSYVTSPRGACHNQSDFFMVELGGTMEEIGIPAIERWEDAGKAAYVARHQQWRTVCNSLVVCFFAVVSPVEIAELLEAAAGYGHDVESMLKAGERAWNLKRVINVRLGWTRALEKLPKLLLEALPQGGQEGHIPDMDVLLREYYQACGWDEVTGMPRVEKLEELGLAFVT